MEYIFINFDCPNFSIKYSNLCVLSKVNKKRKKNSEQIEKQITGRMHKGQLICSRQKYIQHLRHTLQNHIFMLIDFVIDEGDTLIRSTTLRIQTTLMFTTHQYTEFLG